MPDSTISGDAAETRGCVTAGSKQPDERQQQHADKRREQQQHRDVAILEEALDEIFVEMHGDGPQHRAGKGKEEPGQRSRSRGAVTETVARLALRRRVDVQIDDADAAFLEHVDALSRSPT